MRNLAILWCSIGLLSLSAGCSGVRLNDVAGTIKVDGAAPDGAVILFHPTDGKIEHVGSAQAGADGKYSVTFDKRKGLPAGSYKVTVVWPDPSVKPTSTQVMMGLAPTAPDLLDGKYASLAVTPLTMDVTDSMKELPPIDIKTK